MKPPTPANIADTSLARSKAPSIFCHPQSQQSHKANSVSKKFFRFSAYPTSYKVFQELKFLTMSFKLFLLKAARPVMAVGAIAVTGYGYKQWERAKNALHLSANEAEMVTLFHKIDTDMSGHVSRDKLRTALDQAGLHLYSPQITAMMKSADENHDGTINEEEWLHLCSKILHKDIQKHHVPAYHAAEAPKYPIVKPKVGGKEV